MNPEDIGLIGGIAGGVLGVLGGLVGTYFSIRSTSGPRERMFMIKSAIVCWIFVIAFVAGMLLIPTWHRHLLWIPNSLALMFGIRYLNTRQCLIRQEESSM